MKFPLSYWLLIVSAVGGIPCLYLLSGSWEVVPVYMAISFIALVVGYPTSRNTHEKRSKEVS